jgi:hypothetical protein
MEEGPDMDRVENVPDAESDGRDHLEAIKGIGPHFANALYRIGIRRYAELAGYTPDTLSRELLEKTGIKVPSERIMAYDWIGQASKLAESIKITGETYLPEESGDSSNNSLLTQQAGFSLFFDTVSNEQGVQVWQTRLYHEESGEESTFQGADQASWVNWILERVNLPPEIKTGHFEHEAAGERISLEPATVSPASPEIREAIHLEILETRISEQGPSAERPEKQLMAEVRFRVSGSEAEALTGKGIPFRTEIYLVDDKGDTALASSGRGELRLRTYEYINQQSFPVPNLGLYELHTLVLLLPPYQGISYQRGKTIEVIP